MTGGVEAHAHCPLVEPPLSQAAGAYRVHVLARDLKSRGADGTG